MDNRQGLDPNSLEADLQSIREVLQGVAARYQGDSVQLLAILRCLEKLHQQIRDELFLAALPDNRQALYKLLRDMESKGGWPYIQRMKLRALLQHEFVEKDQFHQQP